MNNLINFLIKNASFFLFIFLEFISLLFIIQTNRYQKTFFFNASNTVAGKVFQVQSNVKSYFTLKEENEILKEENAKLREQTKTVYYQEVPTYVNDTVFVNDTLRIDSTETISYIPARVINSTINRKENYFFINKGTANGLNDEAGVISVNGVAGMISNISKHYAVIIPIINTNFKLSAKHKNSEYVGNLEWQGENIRIAHLMEIPIHAEINIGDTIITSGYSRVFSSEIPVGTVEKVDKIAGSGFLDVQVKLLTDYQKLHHVYVLKNEFHEELEELYNEQ